MVLGQHRSTMTSAGVERVSFSAMGTQCEIQYVAPDAQTGKAFAHEAVRWVQAFEARYSRFRPDSLISRINAAAGCDWVEIDADAERMFALADHVFFLTRGIVDPTAFPLIKLWDFKAPQPRVPTGDEVKAALSKVGWSKVCREPGRIFLPETGMGLDLGGYGKEYAVDCVAQMGMALGVDNLLVDFGHDVRVAGTPPGSPCWLIGVENPTFAGTEHSRLAVTDRGVATSGDYIRFFEAGGRRYGHIIDPRNGYPTSNDCRAVTVVAGSCLEAGLLSTTAFALGPDDGLQALEEFIGAEGSIQCPDRELQTRGYCQYVV